MKMVVVSSREFRANQRKYFDLALTNDVVITSRSHGSYRLVPVRESDTLVDQTTVSIRLSTSKKSNRRKTYLRVPPTRFFVIIKIIH